MDLSKIVAGTVIEAKKMVMVVTGENKSKTFFVGYILYKGKNVGECSIAKETFTNPHYKDGIKITYPN